MEPIDRLKFLSSQMSLEPDGERNSPSSVPACYSPKEKNQVFIHPAQMPNGKQIKLLKTLLTSACERDCYYCPFRAGRDFRRATFKPDEFASLFGKLTQSSSAEGIFLSSGIAGGGVRTQDKLLDTADILRNKIGFRGYIHLKIMPGAQKAQVERAMQLADRLSVNLEAPTRSGWRALPRGSSSSRSCSSGCAGSRRSAARSLPIKAGMAAGPRRLPNSLPGARTKPTWSCSAPRSG